MLRHRVIPVVLLDGYAVVKTIRFDVRRNLGNPVTVARIYNTRNVDELVLLDIDASKEGRKIDLDTIRDVASECFMPLTVGGGLNSVDDIGAALSSGADKVTLNTSALKRPELIREGADVFGCQCIVVSIDVKRSPDGEAQVYSHAGVSCDRSLSDWVKEAEALGAGEILINAVDRDGVMGGYDFPLIASLSEQVHIPIIACGGASSISDGAEAVRAGASAIAAASIFHFTSITPEEMKAELARSGFPTRQLIRSSAGDIKRA